MGGWRELKARKNWRLKRGGRSKNGGRLERTRDCFHPDPIRGCTCRGCFRPDPNLCRTCRGSGFAPGPYSGLHLPLVTVSTRTLLGVASAAGHCFHPDPIRGCTCCGSLFPRRPHSRLHLLLHTFSTPILFQFKTHITRYSLITPSNYNCRLQLTLTP